jgi:hypothetical protein
MVNGNWTLVWLSLIETLFIRLVFMWLDHFISWNFNQVIDLKWSMSFFWKGTFRFEKIKFDSSVE